MSNETFLKRINEKNNNTNCNLGKNYRMELFLNEKLFICWPDTVSEHELLVLVGAWLLFSLRNSWST